MTLKLRHEWIKTHLHLYTSARASI